MSLDQIAAELWAFTKLVRPTIWALSIVIPFVLAFSIARWLSGRVRFVFLLLICPLPFWLMASPVFFISFIPRSDLHWWAVGAMMIAPTAVAWAIAAALAAKIGWRGVR